MLQNSACATSLGMSPRFEYVILGLLKHYLTIQIKLGLLKHYVTIQIFNDIQKLLNEYNDGPLLAYK